MVNYICNICNKEFSKKWNYIYHTQIKKRPCKNITPINTDITPINTNITPINTDITPINIKLLEKNKNIQYILDKKDDNSCNYCGFKFSRKDALLRHLKKRCNIKKNEIFNKLLEEKKIIEKEEKKNEIFNKLLEEENKLLKKKIIEKEEKKNEIFNKLLEKRK